MFEFFDSVSTSLGILASFFTNIVNATLTAFSLMADAVALPIQLVMFLPGIVGSCILCTVAFGVVKFILGR